MIKSPCCPGNSVEDLAFTMFVIEQEEAAQSYYADQLDELYSEWEDQITDLELTAARRELTPDEVDFYLYLCKETGIEVKDWIIEG